MIVGKRIRQRLESGNLGTHDEIWGHIEIWGHMT